MTLSITRQILILTLPLLVHFSVLKETMFSNVNEVSYLQFKTKIQTNSLLSNEPKKNKVYRNQNALNKNILSSSHIESKLLQSPEMAITIENEINWKFQSTTTKVDSINTIKEIKPGAYEKYRTIVKRLLKIKPF
ncbi:hypothetical protein [Aestuariibaculum sediminum]|uniref:Uncharacterized protein n=1 Tax=Aestuariibaculum sediminum TaxID=2770637 RepID=A0A8J6Q3B8_9FLAO|nr:hypothetical protein [Aestuariibaculum sediminum]MBD0833404.1 hypothetical protein [Aestuariibaculum sediminum]